MKVLSFDIGVKNFCYCLLENHTILKWNVIDISAKDFTGTSKNIIQLLHEQFPPQEIDVILIENQPCVQNPTMKSIQMLVYSYFMIQAYSFPNMEVKLVSATAKLKVKNNPDPKEKLGYKAKKLKAIELTESYLEDGAWKDMFTQSKKKDDLSDAFLYCKKYVEDRLR